MTFCCLALLATLTPAADEAAGQQVIVVIGAPGTDEYAAAFGQWAARIRHAARQANLRCTMIGLDGERESPPAEKGGAEAAADPRRDESESDSRRFRRAIAQAADEENEPLWILLLGHGTFDGKTAKFNLRGPDLTATELAEWLRSLRRPVVVVNAASASAPFLKALAAPDHVVVTATRSGAEQNYTRFGDYFTRALCGTEEAETSGDEPRASRALDSPDLDKDGQTSLLEAFLFASSRVGEFYQQAGRLATEHALLDDTGDGLGTPADWFRGARAMRTAKDGTEVDGLRAHQLHLVRSESEQALPRETRERRDAIELEIARLRARKSSLTEDAYYETLERLLVKLARLHEPNTRRGAGPEPK